MDGIFVDPQIFANQEIVNSHRERRSSEGVSLGEAAFAPVGVVAGGLDTIGQSLGVVDERTFENFFSSLNRNTGDLYRNNKTGYRFAGDIASMFVGAGASSKLLRSGGVVSSVLQKGGGVGRAIDRVVAIDQARVDDLVQQYAKFGATVGKEGGNATTGFSFANSLRMQTRVAQAGNDLRGAVAAEAFLFGAMRESELFFPEGQKGTDVAYMSAIGIGFGGAVGQLFITPALKRAGAASARSAAKLGDVYSDDAALDLVTSAKRIEGVRQGIPAEVLQVAPEMRGTFNNIEASARRVATAAVEKLGGVSSLAGISKNVPVTKELTDSVLDVSRTNPKMVANVVSIEGPEALENLANKAVAQVKKLEADKALLEVELKKGATDVRVNQINEELAKLKGQIGNLSGDTYAVRVNSIGQLTTNVNQPSIFDGGKIKINRVDDKVEGSSRRVFFAEEGSKDRTIGFSVDGRVIRGNKETSTLSGLSVRERTKPWATMDRALSHLGKVLGDSEIKVKKPKRITAKSSHLTLDYILAAQKKFGAGEGFTELNKVFDLSDFSTLDDVKLASLNKKFAEYKMMKREQEAGLKVGAQLYSSESFGQVLNLRMSDDVGRNNYSLQWFEDLRKSGAKEVGANYLEAMEDFRQHFSLGSTKGTAAKLLAEKGKGMERLLETDMFAKLAKPQEPFTMVVKKGNRVDNSMFDTKPLLDVKTQFERDRDLELGVKVRGTRGAEMLAQIDESLISSPELLKAVQDGSRQLSADAVDQPLVNKLGQLTPFSLNFLLRGVEGADAAGIIADVWQRAAKTWAGDELKNNTTALNMLSSKGNEFSAAKYLHYHSAMQQGWNLEDGVADVAGRFKLEADSAKNVDIADQMGLDGVPEFMPDPVVRNGSALTLDELAVAALGEIRRFSDMRWSMDNVLSNHLGRKAMQYRQGHTIEPTRYGKEMAFITDEHGSVIDVAYGGTVAEARKEAASRIKELTRKRQVGDQTNITVNGKVIVNEGASVPAYNHQGSGSFGTVTRDEVGAYKIAHQQAWNSAYLDVSDAWQQTTGKKAAGARSGLYTDTNFIDGQLLEVSEMFEEAGRKFVATKFSGQLENVRALQEVANVQKQGFSNFVTGESAVAFDDAYDMWANQLLNTSTRNRGSAYGNLGLMGEHIFDSTVGKLFDIARDVKPNAKGGKITDVNRRLADEFGFDPAEYSVRMSERAAGGPMPPTMLKVMRTAAGFTQSMALKFFEVGHAALTTASIATTVPHNVEWFRQGAKESTERFHQRVGVAGDILDDNYAVPNANKLAMTTVYKHLRGEYADVMKEATDLGYLNSQIAEFISDLTTPSKTAFGAGAKKFGDYAGLVSTKSEDYARTISFLTGYELFSKQGKKNPKMAMAMANDFANRVIADYRPHQRAEVFKGASGIPLAMFQTFAINYFQRLLQNVENKQWKALGIQYGTQGFVFGGSSVPGYEFMNEKVLETWDEKNRPEDLVREGFGKGLSDLMLYGTLGNLPKLLGADDGLAFHTRGEMSVPRNVTFGNFGETPIFQLAQRSGAAMRDGFKAAAGNGSVGGLDRLQESLIYAIPNRPVKGLFEYIQGYSTNQRGEMINSEISGLYDFAQRVSGLKTLRDADKAQALWRDRETELSQRNAMSSLSASVEASMRGSDGVNQSSERVQGTVEKYFANGGSPAGFKRWYRERTMRSQYSKSDRALLRAVGQGDRGQDILRFAD